MKKESSTVNPKSPLRGSLTGVLIFVSTILAGSLIILLSQRPVPATNLTGAMVRKHRQRLNAVAARTTIIAPASNDLTHAIFTFGRTDRAIRALAIKTGLTRKGQMRRTEGHLAFALDVAPPELPRDPGRPLRSSLYLVRSDSGCDLVTPGDPRSLIVHFDKFSRHGKKRALKISNAQGEGRVEVRRWSTDDLPGIDPAASFHFGDRDRYVFTLLARILRARIWAPGSPATRCRSTVLLVYRHTRPNQYLIDLKPQAPKGGGWVRFLLAVTINPRGQLVRGEITRLPSTLETRADLFFVHPRPSGKLLSPQEAGFLRLGYKPQSKAGSSATHEVDFAAILSDTSW